MENIHIVLPLCLIKSTLMMAREWPKHVGAISKQIHFKKRHNSSAFVGYFSSVICLIMHGVRHKISIYL